MDKDTEIKQGLASAGIPKSAWKASLPALGQDALRQAVASKAFFAEDPQGAWIHSTPTNANHARQVFYVMAKEMFLTGTTVHCVSLLPFSQMLADGDLPDTILNAKMLFILDFYEAGCPRPYSDEVAVQVRYWIRNRFESGKAVSFLSDAPLEQSNTWWPESMLNFLAARVTQYKVESV